MAAPGREPTLVLLRGGVEVARWPFLDGGRVDLTVVDALARLQLAARTMGCSIRLQDAGADLAGLLELVGLADAVLQGLGQAEGGEQRGVDEVVVPDDPIA